MRRAAACVSPRRRATPRATALAAVVACACATDRSAADDRLACDAFCYLAEANKASLVMLVETGLVAPALAGDIARAVARIVDEQAEEDAARSANYLGFEARLLEIAGEEASRIHIGRSR